MKTDCEANHAAPWASITGLACWAQKTDETIHFQCRIASLRKWSMQQMHAVEHSLNISQFYWHLVL